ncbi:MAG TPA: TetR family transcriptional regulator [Candidatus Dormibacteraeota bacterium]
MSPRRYRMDGRAVATARTRHRIAGAAVLLHSQRGIAATSWDEIAAAAGVNRATVYRHFPRLEELVPACARIAFEAIDLPAPEQLRAALADLPDAGARLERIVRESCACFERGADWLRAARREGDLVPSVAEVNARVSAGASALVEAALDGTFVTDDALRLLCVLIDFPFSQQLRDAGIPAGRVPDVIARLVRQVLAEEERQ